MQLTCATHNNIKVITVEDNRIDAASAIRFKDEMRTLTDDGADHVLLDLSGVAFVDSSGLGAIIASMKQMGDGRRLDLAGLTPDVAKVFRLTRMDSIFVIHKDMAAALQRAAG
ncbi:STAS domain-containing protein [Roseovarius sp. SK2]|uniref:STAS domain-containing protein n=1 Tax=Roseovarius TaxID=74030 RepID=UPI000CDDE4E8|nr:MULTISPECIES: STAS domain-containing protein [Roseovarius]MDD9727913.1 STAS domain-containing protein [Roseovarius sp. SK2]